MIDNLSVIVVTDNEEKNIKECIESIIKITDKILAVMYFIYRYIFRFGFLDGKEGLIFHFLQGFWFRFLIDEKVYELRKKRAINK